MPMLTTDVVRNLAFLPPSRRNRICLKLSQAMAMQAFTRDMNRSMDVLTVAGQDESTRQHLEGESAAYSARSHAQRMNDCADGVFCKAELKR